MNEIIQGDCLEKLKGFDDCSIDSIVCDPPYGISFMGKKWDYDVPSVEIWVECLRVLKPGGHLLSFGGARTYHRMVINIEDAGFEIRDQLMWIFGSGFPKSLAIGKAVDKAQGNKREVIGKYDSRAKFDNCERKSTGQSGIFNESYGKVDLTAPASDDSKQWEGWGTGLKPAHEPIVLARKPLSESTIVKNVLKHGTGGMNIDGCRVGNIGYTNGGKNLGIAFGTGDGIKKNERCDGSQGRFPANLIIDGSDEVLAEFPETKSGKTTDKFTANSMFGKRKMKAQNGSEGSAARFFYTAKASKSERNKGLKGFEEKRVNYMAKANGTGEASMDSFSSINANHHPTVKPIALMRYLCRLITPAKGIVLDPFCGSGSTCCAAVLEGFNYIGIELEQEYCEMSRARIKYWSKQEKSMFDNQ